MNLRELIDAVRAEGYSQANAEARVCQDVVLKAIDESAFADHITVKGGVVMRSITGDARRATQDMDLDFIRYSLRDDSIRSFISRLNCLDGISIQIAGAIEELSQQEYHRKDHLPGRSVKAEVLLFSPVRDSWRDDANPPDQGECLL